MIMYLYVKNITDFCLAFFLVLFLWPIMLLCAIFIKIEDPNGKVIFSQGRTGKGKKEFKVYKFRSMKVESERHDQKLSDSERMLKFGRFMRKTSLDELPQLFNILKGEMSFIGPRPLPTIYLPYYNKFEIHRHDVKPGISGWAQVNGRNNLNWNEKFSLDIEYVENLSFSLDIKVLLMTFIKVLKGSDVAVRGENEVMDFHEYRLKEENDNIIP